MSQTTATNDGSESTVEERSYQGDPNNWSIDDPYRGPSVPLCVRKAGATQPTELVEYEHGVSRRGHAAAYECLECGEEKWLVTSAVETQHRCSECGRVQWFRVRDVDYNEVK